MIECRNVKIGEGIPKICIPVVGKDDEDILKQMSVNLPYDLIELRIDFYEEVNDTNKVLSLLNKVRRSVECPILFTCRSQNEGGNSSLTLQQYSELLTEVISSGYVDLIDIELNIGNKTVFDLVDKAHKKGVLVIMSYHNFDKTPTYDEMIDILEKMEVMGGDILKLAVMPVSKKDVVTLMNVSTLMSSKLDKPLVMISMGDLGKITRIAGELIGSSVTFGSALKSSAPGQIQVNDLKLLLESVHR